MYYPLKRIRNQTQMFHQRDKDNPRIQDKRDDCGYGGNENGDRTRICPYEPDTNNSCNLPSHDTPQIHNPQPPDTIPQEPDGSPEPLQSFPLVSSLPSYASSASDPEEKRTAQSTTQCLSRALMRRRQMWDFSDKRRMRGLRESGSAELEGLEDLGSDMRVGMDSTSPWMEGSSPCLNPSSN